MAAGEAESTTRELLDAADEAGMLAAGRLSSL